MAVSAAAPVEYRGLKASSWDLFLGPGTHWEDTFFFREMLARFGQPGLEVGCGTGRVLLHFLADGFDIDGVDNAPEMLAICRNKAARLGLRPTLFQQPMEALALPRRYRSIIISAGSFQLVTEPLLAGAALRRLAAHLEPGGGLVLRLVWLWQPGEPEETDWALVRAATRPDDGALVRWWQRVWRDVGRQLEHTEDRYEVVIRGEVVATEYYRQSPAARWYSPEQAAGLCRAAGFGPVEVIEQPGSLPDSRHFAVVAIKE